MPLLWGDSRPQPLPTLREFLLALVSLLLAVGWYQEAETADRLADSAVIYERAYERCVTSLGDGMVELEDQRDELVGVLEEALIR